MTPRMLREFLQCHSTLQGILLWLAGQWPTADLEITCIHRTPEEEAAAAGKSGIHVAGPPYRAIDVRVSNLVGNPQASADFWGDFVNAKYVYDPGRPELSVAVTAPHGTGPHIHLQVHDHTGFRSDPSNHV